ncbi:NrdH-redoxin [Oenococcus oeni]|uniref:Glutaredoxin-like protein NrdH n=1 Tax=Oenococcus oeni TaxID=1247 RepID=A0AAJ2P3E1_OENOE|nr:glutaredoxin-like protein NrdH [Oenococcus oeni]MDV7714862.1 glutaredoxin-like protein NrdH [Oenococcus oeni]OIM25170.1 NrdH-redoxin [Oenococcus oeni]
MIKIYTRDDCPQCYMTKKWLDNHQLKYTEINISRDKKYIDYLKAKGAQQTPYVVTDRENWSGFRPNKLIMLIK